jgi:hypothetical protein
MVCSFVTHYGGWVVPDPLLDTLQRYVYVCTAVTNETLAYDCRSSGKKVAVSIVGDPTMVGAQINDGLISKQPGTLTFAVQSIADQPISKRMWMMPCSHAVSACLRLRQ